MAGSVNKVILIGRLGQDPKLNYLPSGSPVAEFTVATDDSYKNKEGQKVEQTEWHRVKVYGKSAEFCGNYLSKGRLVYVEGTIRTRSWDDKDGQKRYTTEIIVSAPGHTVQFMDSKGGAEAAPRDYGQEQGQQGGGRPSYQNQGQGRNQGQQYQGQGQGQNQGQQRGGGRPQQQREDDLGPAFPSEASGMDDVPF